MRALHLPVLAAGMAVCLPSLAQAISPFAPLDPGEFDRILARIEAAAQPAAIPDLYAQGLAYAAHAQFEGRPGTAAEAVRRIEAAVHARPNPPASGIAAMAQARRHYALLGAKLPFIPLAESLFAPGETPRIDTDYGSATVLLLFPASCGPCLEMASGMRSVLFRLSDRQVHLYGLMAQPADPTAALDSPPLPVDPGSPAARLRGTPTLIVPPAVLAQFGASTFPFAIATDSFGIVRFLGPAPAAGMLDPGGFVDRLSAHIAQLWPPAPRPR